MFLPNSLSTNSLLPRDSVAERSRARRHTGWLVSMLTLISLAINFPVQAQTLTTLATFNGSNRGAPISGVKIDSMGNLYGTTSVGGSYGAGTVWEFAQGSNHITTLVNLNGTNGANPDGVTLDSNDNLYGTANRGGAKVGEGTVWEIAKGSRKLVTLANFVRINGMYSDAGVTLDSKGNLFGSTYNSNANKSTMVWEIAKGSRHITTLVKLNGNNSAYPIGGMTLDSSGNIYGTSFRPFKIGNKSSMSSAMNCGTVWEITKGSSMLTTLARFHIDNGANPYAGPTLDKRGNLYGTTFMGGANGDGTVWEIARGTNTFITLANFNQDSGRYPFAGVTLDSKGNLYGTTSRGGVNDGGTVWKIAKESGAITILVKLNGENNFTPDTGVIFDRIGNLYGTTFNGVNDDGTIFEVSNIPGMSRPPDLDVPSKRLNLSKDVLLILGLGALVIGGLVMRKRLKSAWHS